MALGSRLSDHLTPANVAELAQAAEHARRIGLPLNQHLTVHIANLDDVPGRNSPQGRLAGLLELARHWLDRRGFPLAAIWVLEAGLKGPHAHVNLHVPLHLVGAFRPMLPRWLRHDPAGDQHSPAIQLDYAPRSAGLLKYMLKGMHPAAAAAYGVRPVPQGTIRGKRCGCTHVLGRTARKRYGLAKPLGRPYEGSEVISAA